MYFKNEILSRFSPTIFQLQGLPASVTVVSNSTTVTRPTKVLKQPMTSSPIAANKKVIDIVDLSDDDDGAPRPMATQAQNNSLRLIPTNELRGNNTSIVNNGIAKLGTGSYNHQGVTLVPVSRPPGITTVVKILNHPAPLPLPPKFQNTNPLLKDMPPKPTLKISRLNAGKKYNYNTFDRHFSITVVFLL
jgi:hypothetical protein